MANDKGGNAKSLFSIDDGDSAGISGLKQYAPVDLLSKDMVGVAETSALGAKFWITADGKIAYDASSSDSINALAAGQTLTD